MYVMHCGILMVLYTMHQGFGLDRELGALGRGRYAIWQ